MISHDRSFLDKSINNILELRKGNTTVYLGNYSYYIKERKERIEHRKKVYNNQQKMIELGQYVKSFTAIIADETELQPSE